MKKSERVELELQIEAWTARAILFHDGNKEKTVWLPMALIDVEGEISKGSICTVTMYESLAIEKGLV